MCRSIVGVYLFFVFLHYTLVIIYLVISSYVCHTTPIKTFITYPYPCQVYYLRYNHEHRPSRHQCECREVEYSRHIPSHFSLVLALHSTLSC
jgi:hypothetical protein